MLYINIIDVTLVRWTKGLKIFQKNVWKIHVFKRSCNNVMHMYLVRDSRDIFSRTTNKHDNLILSPLVPSQIYLFSMNSIY